MNIKSIALGFMSFVVRSAILAVAILIIVRAGEEAYDFGFRIYTEEAMSPEPGREVAVTIVQGDSTMDVAKMFEEKGLIRDYKLFYVQKKCSVYDADIKPGFYTLNTSMTADDMFAIIAGRKDEEGEEGEEGETEETMDEAGGDSAPADGVIEGESALDKVSGEWEGTEGEDEEVHDPFEEGSESETAGEEGGGGE